ncbi:RICIN domain-containing protein [Kitasatospora sp. NPDC058046]|uniref:RICIN domain-containing protein n=1 Tax=Kitasatospora sp. NPDC058046 TaxID=3346312 RepID=UPI0036D76B62
MPPRPHRRHARARRPLNVLGAAAAACVLLLTAAPVASAAPSSAGPLAADPSSNYRCDPGLYRINTADEGRPLTVALSSGNYGTVLQYFWNNESNQKWRVCRKQTSDGRTLAYLQDAMRRWCMAVDHWGQENGALITTYGCIDEDVPANQSFWMAYVHGSTLFALQAQHSGKWVAAANHSDKDIDQMVQDVKPDLFHLVAV